MTPEDVINYLKEKEIDINLSKAEKVSETIITDTERINLALENKGFQAKVSDIDCTNDVSWHIKYVIETNVFIN